MKLDLAYDHTRARDAARMAIHAWFARRAAAMDPLGPIHAAKLRAAARDPVAGSHPLAAEARARDLSLDAMRAMVVRAAEAMDADLLALDGQRREALIELDRAATGPAITAIHHRFSGA